MSDTKASALLSCIEGATHDDLDEIEVRMVRLQGELACLQLLHKALSAKLNGKPDRAEKAERTEAVRSTGEKVDGRQRLTPEVSERVRRTIALHLAKNGACSTEAIGELVKLPPTKVYYLLQHPWFVRSEKGYHITPEGRQAVC